KEIKIRVKTDPSDAIVLLDGERLGYTLFEGTVFVASGSHVLKIRRRGYAPMKIDINLDADVDRDFTLQPAAPSGAFNGAWALGDTASGTRARRSPTCTFRSAT